MKRINDFLKEVQNEKEIQSIFGGRIFDTGAVDDDGNYEDEWDDKDNNYEISAGDTICFNV